MGLGPEGAVVAEAVEERGFPEVEEGGHRGEGAAEELVVEAGGAPDDFVEGFGGLLGHGWMVVEGCTWWHTGVMVGCGLQCRGGMFVGLESVYDHDRLVTETLVHDRHSK